MAASPRSSARWSSTSRRSDAEARTTSRAGSDNDGRPGGRGHRSENVEAPDVVVYSSAIKPDNPGSSSQGSDPKSSARRDARRRADACKGQCVASRARTADDDHLARRDRAPSPGSTHPSSWAAKVMRSARTRAPGSTVTCFVARPTSDGSFLKLTRRRRHHEHRRAEHLDHYRTHERSGRLHRFASRSFTASPSSASITRTCRRSRRRISAAT